MSSVREFQRTSVMVDHKTIPAYAIFCNECGSRETLTISTRSNTLPEAMIAKKFAAKGWDVGKRMRDDRCPACVAFQQASKKQCQTQKAIDMPQTRETTDAAVKTADVISLTKKADPPPAMEREDRRIIFAEIDAHYIDEKKGYDTDWNDERIAKGLNVPLAWVREIRDANFGPEIGTGVSDEMMRIEEAISRANAVVASMNELMESIKRERDLIDERYVSIEKDAGNVSSAVAGAVAQIREIRKRIG